MLDTFTTVSCLIIICAFLGAWLYVVNIEKQDFTKHKKWIEQLPSIVSTLGVFGTFAGITKGLVTFDTANLDTSIPLLLGGLKTAFFTSLCGMFFSLILSRIVARKFEKEESGSEIDKAARLIVETLNRNQNYLPRVLNNSNTNLVKQLSEDATIKAIKADIEQLKDDIEEIKGHIEEIKGIASSVSEQNERVVNVLNNIKVSAGNTADEIPRLRAVAVTATASISAIDNNIEEINGTLTNLENDASEINENVEAIKSKGEEVF